MIARAAQWRINALAVGVALHSPDDVVPRLFRVLADAEMVAERNCALDTPAERAIHGCYLAYAAGRARADGDLALADALDEASVLVIDDWGLDAAADLRRAQADATGATTP